MEKAFKPYEPDYMRLYIVFVSPLKVIMCFHAPVGSQFVLEKENNDYKETESMNLLPIQTRTAANLFNQLFIFFS